MKSIVSQRMKRSFTEIAIVWRVGGEISRCATVVTPEVAYAPMSTPYTIVKQSQWMRRSFTEIAIVWRVGGEISRCATGCDA